ncbi:drug/metabolite transporter (DMT)-like permease [Saonia flava]|uniref:Drug/metabolite transporter (DMT)-like permease n=1 Tax=Saonia flava TaxID=523696 RepID=A0A846QWK5_9FLAO|nr:EamA family transporter [Saonia flava]NJB69965.1 drug/metabolite transporter (DMT)-like permease [Saonia flava]
MGKPQSSTLIILAFFSIYVIWGSTYLLNKIAVTELPPFMLASIRFIVAGILIFILSRLMGISISISKRQFINTSIAGFLFLTLGNGIAVWALKYVDSSFAALLISGQPLVILILMRIVEGKKIQPMSYVGVVLGVLGMYLLASQRQIVLQEGAIVGIAMIFACMISWAFGSLFVAKAELPSNFFVNTGYQMIIGGVLMAGFSLFYEDAWSWPSQWSGKVQLSMILLVVFGSIVAFTSFNYLLKVVSPEKVATNTYVNPIIALLLGWYFLNEHITLQSIIAAVILLTGVYFINTKKKLRGYSRFFSRKRNE